ncbi:hypothetical protein [Streptomyces sp. NPDC058657]|uniref:hypothetical protein n=1 Tax=unclassified Streptomyces TaxID=2593676 RepID=UPI0036615295
MQIHRTAPTRAFSIIQNALAQDHRISWCAAGVLLYLLSLPESAKASVRALAGKRTEGRARIAQALRDLEAARYLRRLVVKVPETGEFRTVYEVFDQPYDSPVAEGEPESGQNRASGDGAARASGPKPSVSSTSLQEPPTLRDAKRPAPVGAVAPGGKVPPPRKAPPSRRAAEVPVEQSVAAPGQDDARHGRAARFLHTLGHVAPGLSLGIAEALKLAPLVVDCWDKGVSESALRRSLTSGLPEDVYSAPGLLASRLSRKSAGKTAAVPVRRSEPRLSAACEGCSARLPRPGRCKACAGEAVRWGDVLQLGGPAGLTAEPS